MATLISHFYNEEFLLPFWLKHHKRLFTYGIMIDYDSTDNSINIIKEICPTWEIRKSRNREFVAEEVDKEVMDIERTINGWKTCLNTTEFLFIDNLEGYLTLNTQPIFNPNSIIKGGMYHDNPIMGFRTQGVIMVDSEKDRWKPIIDKDLFLQKSYGFIEPETGYLTGQRSRSRIIHKMSTVQYLPGRHDLKSYRNIVFDPHLYLLWFGFSPYEKTKHRKMQNDSRVPKNYNSGHRPTLKEWDDMYLKYRKMSYDLKTIPEYKKMLNTICSTFNLN